MFDIGFSELLVIAVVALVVLGPERLPKAARFAGLWVRRARNQWDSVKQELERELQAEDIKRQMQEVRQGMQDTENQLRASGEAIRREAQEAQQQGDTLVQEVRAPAPADPPPHMGSLSPADAPVQERIAPEPMPATPPEAGAPPPQSTERQP
ncbi:TPA: twin-arginine translocase subunit TatB [Stenotrophomonas maltophilia]|uniref:Sec-independent protein translocase protein TatB n=1 Tax=Stenotrophomonas maltophilia TaxID=40324 RepID=UPI0021C6A9EA|nr:Sec-independent protein translocase protein TatB [Stenotrophomonas maltophilia]ELK6800871.1 twin-arginine translocase subunit TatB [Stenotrophomonas maltophilia]MCU1194078.1 twin-arginine translocase subunit TatB [Stenotrophomonas maltophilia]HDS1582339.1 twin-arginine translocase subunit TatB [Stenotrophomonas maltophilia]